MIQRCGNDHVGPNYFHDNGIANKSKFFRKEDFEQELVTILQNNVMKFNGVRTLEIGL